LKKGSDQDRGEVVKGSLFSVKRHVLTSLCYILQDD
jgi:hypothetical protein